MCEPARKQILTFHFLHFQSNEVILEYMTFKNDPERDPSPQDTSEEDRKAWLSVHVQKCEKLGTPSITCEFVRKIFVSCL